MVFAAPIYRSISPQGGTGPFYKSAASCAAALIRCPNGPSASGGPLDQ
ncbi:hypothetical protein T08_12105 [Trichinella sp. T8]|nr:hypothetical protein T08_12105 [Trichinella sp. T8]